MNFYCQSCQEPYSPDETECTNCGWTFNESSQGLIVPPSIPVRLTSRAPVARAEIAVTIDRTESSRQFEKGIPQTVETILREVEPEVASMTVWLQSHGDEDHGQEPILHTDAGSVSQVVSDMATIRFAGGGPPDEDHLKAFEHLTNTTPFSGRHGVLLALINAESKPLGNARTPRQLGEELQDRGILVYVVGQPAPRIVEFVRAADGMFVPISNTPTPTELSDVAQRISRSMTVTIPSGSTTPITV